MKFFLTMQLVYSYWWPLKGFRRILQAPDIFIDNEINDTKYIKVVMKKKTYWMKISNNEASSRNLILIGF